MSEMEKLSSSEGKKKLKKLFKTSNSSNHVFELRIFIFRQSCPKQPYLKLAYRYDALVKLAEYLGEPWCCLNIQVKIRNMSSLGCK